MKPLQQIVLNEKNVDELCVFGDGDAQLALYHTVKGYITENVVNVHRGTLTDKNPNYKCDVVVAKSARYDIIAARRYVPNVPTLVASIRYQAQIKDKQLNQTYSHMGTMARMMFDLLKDIKRPTR